MRSGTEETTQNGGRLGRFAWGTVGYNLAVILWGAYVRASGSGAGCGSNWPLCGGEVVPRSPSVETLVELTHRATSGLALLLVLALAAWVWRVYPRGDTARFWAALTVFFMLMEAAIGAGLVLFELVADNESMARALFMATHLGNTFLLLAAMTLTAHRTNGGAIPVWRGHGRLGGVAFAALAATIVVGMSGAVAALGDTLFPAGSLQEALRQDLSPTSHVLIQLRLLHPLFAIASAVLLLYLASQVRQRAPRARSYAGRLSLLVYLQLGLGTLNIVLLAPIPMQLLHLLIADFLWIVLVLTVTVAFATADDPEPIPTTAVARAA